MSELSKKDRHDYSKYDEMSTESLEEILRLDFQMSEDVESDIDAIMYISEVIAKRKEQSNTPAVDVDAAWEQFRTKYLPYADGRSLYDFGDDEPNCLEPEAAAFDSDTSSTDGKKHISACTKRRLGRAALIAAAIAVLLSLMTVTAYALGYDLWGSFARWTQDVFSFVPASEAGNADSEKGPSVIEDDFASIQEALDTYGVTESLAPTWVPDGFELDSVSVDASSDPRMIIFQTGYCREEQWIIVQIIMHRDSDSAAYAEWQRDDDIITTIEIDNCTFYIMKNAERECAVWSNGIFEGYISGDITFEELSEVVKSIYVRNE